MYKSKKFEILVLLSILLISPLNPVESSNDTLALSNLKYSLNPISPINTQSVLIDGVISNGEYDYSILLDAGSSFYLHYSIVGDTIYMGISATATGWISLGWGVEINRMTDIDYVIGYVSSGVPYVEDFIGLSGTTHASDISQGGTDDLISFGGSDDGTTTVLEYSRLLDTGDVTTDYAIVPGTPLDIQWGYAAADDFTSIHSAIGSVLGFTFELPPATVPDAPTNLQGLADVGQVTLSWSAPYDGGEAITDYTVKRGTTSGVYTNTFSAGTTTSYTDTGLTNSQTYYYVVSATNLVGESINSVEITATPGNKPAAPTDLVAIGQQDQISLTWTAAVSDLPVISYTVKRGTATGVYIDSFTTTSNSYTDTSVENGITYYYTVSATSIIGEGADATETSSMAFGVPAAPVISVYTSTSIDLKWEIPNDGGSPITGYNIYRSTTSGATVYLNTTADNYYNDSSINKGAIYYYTVTTVNFYGESVKSNEVIATLVAMPDAPIDLVTIVNDSQVKLYFVPPPDDGGSPVIDYLIYRSTTSGEPYTYIGNTEAVLMYTDNDLVNGITYYYAVKSVTKVGASFFSEEVSGTPVSTPTAPQNPTLRTNGTAVFISWNEPLTDSGYTITGYTVERSLTAGGPYTQIVSTTELSYIDTNLTTNTEYFYIISAVNSLGSTASKEVSIIHGATPSEPLNLLTISYSNNITITWDAPAERSADVIGYKIYRSDKSGTEYILIGKTNSLRYEDDNINLGQTYYYVITAISIAGESAVSAEVTGSIPQLPDAPINLIGTAGDTLVDLSWTATSDGGSPITDYIVKRGTTSGVYTDTFSAGTFTSYSDTGLTNGVTYYYIVIAVNAEGNSTPSDEIAITPSTSPGIPSSLSAEYIDGVVVLSWICDDGGLTTSYFVQRKISGPWWTDLGSTTELYFDDTTAFEGSTYSYRVYAENANGVSGVSLTLSFTVVGVPSEPLSLTGDNSATLSWTAPTYDGGYTITGYTIYRSITMGSGYTLLGTTTDTTYTDATVVASGKYYYVVTASNSIGESDYSNEILITIANVPSEPQTVTSTHGDTFVYIQWSAPASDGGSAITSYTIYRSNGSVYSFVATTSEINYNDTGLINGQTYYYLVTASNVNGEGTYSSEISNTPCTVANAPILNLTPADEEITLNWIDNGDNGAVITGYKIYRSETSGVYGAELTTLGVVYTYTDDTVDNGITYYYTIVAVNSEGDSAKATEQSTTPSNVPTSPENVVLTASIDQIVLDWDVSTSESLILSYKIYRSTTSGSGYVLIGSTASNTYTDVTILEGITYYYVIIAVNESGDSAQSTEVSATTGVVPTIPGNVQIGLMNNEITLTWNEVNTAIEYRIYRSEISGSAYTLVGSSVSLSFTDISALYGITYYYVVVAYNMVGEGTGSVEVSITISSIPTAPLKLNSTTNYDTVTLTWLAPISNGGSAISSYIIYRSTTNGGYVQIGTTTDLTYIDTVTVLGINYYYVVVAVNEIGVSGYSLHTVALPGGVPDKITDITLTSGDTFITIEWLKPSDGGFEVYFYYEIYRYDEISGMFELLAKVFDTIYTDEELTNGVIYQYYIVTHNVMGFAENSDTVMTMPVTLASSPVDPTAEHSDDGIHISWSSPLDTGGLTILSYNIYRANATDNLYGLIGNSQTTNYNDTDVHEHGLEYFYIISAITSEGESAFSNSVSIIGYTISDSVENITITQNGSDIELIWNVPAQTGGMNITVYHLYRSTDVDNMAFLANVTENEFTDTVDLGVTYYYMIVPHTDIGCGNVSEVVSIFPTGVPEAPLDLVFTTTNETITIEWTAPFDNGDTITHYTVYRQFDSDSTMTAIANVTSNSFIDTDIEADVTYIYVITASNSLGESIKSERLTVVSPMEIEEVENPLPENPTAENNDTASDATNSTQEIVIPESLKITGYAIGIGSLGFLIASVVLVKKRMI